MQTLSLRATPSAYIMLAKQVYHMAQAIYHICKANISLKKHCNRSAFSLFFVLCAFSKGKFHSLFARQNHFADTDVLRGDFEHFVVIQKFD